MKPTDTPRSLRPSVPARAVTIAVLVIVLAYMLGPVYWLIVSSTKSNSDLLTSSGWWFSGHNSFSANYSALMSWTQGLFWRWILNSLLYSSVAGVWARSCRSPPATAWRSSSSRGGRRPGRHPSPACSCPSRC